MTNISEVYKHLQDFIAMLNSEAGKPWGDISVYIALVPIAFLIIFWCFRRQLHPTVPLTQSSNTGAKVLGTQSYNQIFEKFLLMAAVAASGWFAMAPLLLSIAKSLESLRWVALAIPFIVSGLSCGFFNDVIGNDRRALVQLPLTYFVAPSCLVLGTVFAIGLGLFQASLGLVIISGFIFSLVALIVGFIFATASLLGVLVAFIVHESW